MDATQAPQGGGGSGGRKEKNQNIQVYVRVRPMNTQETAKHAAEVIDTPGNREVVVKERTSSNLSKTFTFDRVFGARSKQVDVYKAVVSPLLAEVLLGYNCTVFAYGQTGTGKTFTMEGERKANSGIENDPNAGILPRALSELFDELRLMNCEFSVRASFLELYNEELFDLLAPIEETKAKTLRLFEDATRKGSVIIQGLEEVIVNNKHEVYAVLDKGTQQRKTAATLMNATSSRSHTIFTITVHIKESSVEGEEMVKVGKLHLVDLAGSENIGKSGAVDKRAREAGSINQSLLTLGRVISALVERTPHVPYRESKLTRLLQDSLGGKTKTSIIATISPAVTNIEETLSTLDYAHRAKNIMNRPEVNQKISKKEAITMYTDEIERLRRDLNAARDKNGIFLDQENYSQMVCQIESQHHELNEKSNKIRDLEETLTKREDELRDAMEMNDELRVDNYAKQTILENLQAQKQTLESKLNVTYRKNDELTHLLQYHEDTEQKMSSEANTLLHTANDTVAIIEDLHGRLERKRQVENTNWTNGERFRDEFRQSVNDIIDSVNDIKQHHTIGISDLRSLLSIRASERKQTSEAYTILFYQTTAKVETLQNALSTTCASFNSLTKSHHESTTAFIEHEGLTGAEKLKAHMETLSSSLENLKKQFMSVKEDLVTLQNVIAIKFDGMNKLVMESLKANVQRFSNTEKALNGLRDKWSSAMESVFTKFAAFHTEQEKFKADHHLKVAKLCEGLYQLRSETENHLTEAATAFSFINTKLETTNKESSSEIICERNNIRAVRIPAEALLKKAVDFRTENVANHQLMLGRMHDRMEAVEPCFKEIKSRTDNMAKDFSEGFSGIAAKVTNMGKETMTDLEKTDNHIYKLMEAQYSEIQSLKSECYDQMQLVTDGEDKCIDKLVQHMDDQCDFVTTGCTEVTSYLSQTAGAVDEFWEQTYLSDTPTGATPMRKKFEFPTSLSMPSPHSRVIARYRNHENNLQADIDNCVEEYDPSAATLELDKISEQDDDMHTDEENKDPQGKSRQNKESPVPSTTESSEEKTPRKQNEQKGSMVAQTNADKKTEDEGKKVEKQQVDANKTGKQQGKKNAKNRRKSGQKGVLRTPN